MARKRPSDFEPAIRRVRYRELTIFEITEEELELLEQGSPDSILLNFSICFTSAATSFLIALLTTTIESDRIYNTFVIVVAVSAVAGIVLLALWLRSRRSVSQVLHRIRDRAVFESADQAAPVVENPNGPADTNS